MTWPHLIMKEKGKKCKNTILIYLDYNMGRQKDVKNFEFL